MVVLTLKNLQQQTFTIDIDMSASVRELKEKVEKQKGSDYPAVGQKLIYAGKILQDDSSLDTYNIDEKKFLVIMVTKPKSVPVPTCEPSDPTAPPEATQPEPEPVVSVSDTSSATAMETSAPNTPGTVESAPTEAADGSQAASGGNLGTAESLLVMGEEFNRMVENIMEMGYDRPQVERALRASFNNPYTAVQYLVDGIPPNLDNEPRGDVPPPTVSEGDDGGDIDPEEDPLNFLRSQPQFEQMRQMIRSNPQLLDAFIQQIGVTNPQLLQVIQQNQQAFVRMLNEGGVSSGGNTGSSDSQSSGGGGGGGGRAAGQNSILVSPQDRDAIERLKALGNFPEDVVIQAYFACEKNENLAAEFLFSQTWD